jgi:predicted RNase H-like HicB family nuclease
VRQEIEMKFRVVIQQDQDGKFVAHCPTLPGCWSQGDTHDEAKRNIADAIEGYLASLKKHGDPIPPPITEEVIEIEA